MKEIAMKKIFLILFALTMGCELLAQNRDSFFEPYNDEPYNRIENPDNLLSMPMSALGSKTNESAPVGSGLIILTVVGLGYAIKKRRK